VHHEQRFMTGLSRWRMARRLGAALFGITALSVVALALTAILNAETTQSSERREAAAVSRLVTVRQLSDGYSNIKVDIIQIQQFLTDISATRGQNGLDDGFSEAAKYAGQFPQHLAEARAAATALNSVEALKTLSEVEQRFPAYYDLGKRLSQAYIADGPPGGNRLMPEFDKTSDRLWSSLEAVKKAVDQATVAAGRDQTQAMAEQSSQAQVTLAVQVVAGLVIMAAGLAIFVYVKRSLLAPLDEATGAIRRLADGDTSMVLSGVDRADELGDLARAFNIFRSALIERLQLEADAKEAESRAEADRERTEREALARSEAAVVGSLGEGLSELARGNLDYRIRGALPPAFAKLRDDFNQTTETLQTMLGEVVDCAASITSSAGDIGGAARDLSQRTSSQATRVEETAAAVAELTQTVSQSSRLAMTARDRVLAAAEVGQRSGEDAAKAVSAMDAIKSSSSRISAIISVIDEIAFQTNLLALNAGVEAARAGEAGRGFAVVASEVRSLAQKSADAAREIKSLIDESGRHVTHGVGLVGAAGTSMQEIARHVSDVSALIDSIANAASEQASALNNINSALGDLDHVTQHNAAMAEESSEAGQSLLGQASRLSGLVEQFQIGGHAQGAAGRSGRAA
jgi:methyl-accepting chemotaxis protein